MIIFVVVVADLGMHRPFNPNAMVLVGGISVATYLLAIFAVLGITRRRTGRWSVEQPAVGRPHRPAVHLLIHVGRILAVSATGGHQSVRSASTGSR